LTTEDFKKISADIPKKPGIYKFYDAKDTILYVGKAKNLKNRLSSYFGVKKHQAFKTRTLVKNADHIDFMIVDTEHDALLLENTLIKKFQPRYNVNLKDGKSYTYLCIKKERFPRVFFTRRVIKDGSTYFGPYTSKYKTKQIMEAIRRLFQLRTCSLNLSEDNIEKGKFKVCLEYHIKNCKGACVGKETEEEYLTKITQIKNILRGKYKPVKDFLKQEMKQAVENLEFEHAQNFKERLSYLDEYQAKSTVVSASIQDVDVFSIQDEEKWAYVNYLKVINGSLINSDTIDLKKNLNDNIEDLLSFSIQMLREKFNSIAPEIIVPQMISGMGPKISVVVPQRGDKKKLLELAQKNLVYYALQRRKEAMNKQNKQTPAERILRTLQEDLQMNVLPFHIECFDNSNMQGTNPTSSCVVFKNAKPSKKDYRHFKVKTVEGPNDFASMEEVVFRRYSRLLKEKESLPQLIIIDGGKGQLSSSVQSLKKLDLYGKITIIGIAKRLEEIYFPGDPLPLYINKKSESLKLIQHARNEAHRFAINYHRLLRSKDLIKTELTEIKGIGKGTSTKLLKHFGSVKQIKEASVDDLISVIGPTLAKKIKSKFSKSEEE